MYEATSEEDVNVFDGDAYLPQENFPITPAAEADPSRDRRPRTSRGRRSRRRSRRGIVSPCAGALHKVNVTHQPFLDGGGSPFQGQYRPSCEDKLVTVRTGQTTAPNFNLFTEVPLPTHFWGLTINDLGLAYDKRSVNYGEAEGMPERPGRSLRLRRAPRGHGAHRLQRLLRGPRAVHRHLQLPGAGGTVREHVQVRRQRPGSARPRQRGLQPAVPHHRGHLPGLARALHGDRRGAHAGRQHRAAPDGTQVNLAQCDLGPDYPQLFSVDHPYARQTTTTRTSDNTVVTVNGRHFGGSAGSLSLGGTTVPDGVVERREDHLPGAGRQQPPRAAGASDHPRRRPDQRQLAHPAGDRAGLRAAVLRPTRGSRKWARASSSRPSRTPWSSPGPRRLRATGWSWSGPTPRRRPTRAGSTPRT